MNDNSLTQRILTRDYPSYEYVRVFARIGDEPIRLFKDTGTKDKDMRYMCNTLPVLYGKSSYALLDQLRPIAKQKRRVMETYDLYDRKDEPTVYDSRFTDTAQYF